MKIALILKGLTYHEKYPHRYGIPLYTIDFRDTCNSVKTNIIEPYIKAGHEIDIFILTSHSTDEIENELLDFYKPKKWLFTEYTNIPLGTDLCEPFILKQAIHSLQIMQEYEIENGFKYDFVHITRPDLYFYQDITSVNIDYDVINIPFWHIAKTPKGPVFSSEDCWLGVPGNKINKLIQGFYTLLNEKKSMHITGAFMLNNGETVKYLFGEKGDGAYDYPLYKFGRHIFGNVKNFSTIQDNLNVPMNRIFHSIEEKEFVENGKLYPIYRNKSNIEYST